MDEVAYAAEAWSDLFVGAAGAGAALAGLVFVAVSINIERILGLPGVPSRALATVLLLLNVVVASVFGLAPQSTTALGLELLISGLAVTAAVVVLFSQAERHAQAPRGSAATNMIVAGLATLPFAVAGASMLAEAGGGLYWVLAGIVAALVGAVVNAWVLLVEILR